MFKAIRKEQDKNDKNDVLLVTIDIFDGNTVAQASMITLYMPN